MKDLPSVICQEELRPSFEIAAGAPGRTWMALNSTCGCNVNLAACIILKEHPDNKCGFDYLATFCPKCNKPQFAMLIGAEADCPVKSTAE